MGLLLVFAAGYVLGSRAGEESFDEVVKAANAIRRSDEFKGLVSALRAHAADSLRGVADMIERHGDTADGEVATSSDLLERVRLLSSRR